MTAHSIGTNRTVKLTIGPYRIIPIPTGLFGLDGGAMFGTVPKILWEKSNPADEHNRIEMEARALLLDGGPGQRILIDCGIGADFVAKYGEKTGAKFGEMYSVSTESSVETSLGKLGLKTSDINHVILTHLHFDHCGGATKFDGTKLVPTFEMARYYVQKENYDTAMRPNIRERASYYSPNFEPLREAGVLEFIEGERTNLLPGVSLLLSSGHTHAQQVVKITDGTETLLYCGDLIPTSSHVRLAWVMGYDLEPLKLIEEKRALLTQAAKEKWTLFFEHDAYADAARVEEVKGDFAVTERLALA